MSNEIATMKDVATVNDLRPCKSKEKLGHADRKMYVELVEKEFEAQRTQFQQHVQEAQEDCMEKHRERIGYKALKAKHDAVSSDLDDLKEVKRVELENFKKKQADEIALAEKKLQRTVHALHIQGFKTDGELYTGRGYYHNECDGLDFEVKEGIKKAKKIQKELQEIDDRITPAHNLKNKIIGALLDATYKAEAAVISRQVLGNGILSGVTKGELEELYKNLK